MIPYLDYTTPTFYDDISARSRSCWAASRIPAEFTKGVQEKFDEWAQSR